MDISMSNTFSHRRGSQSESRATPVQGRMPRQPSLTSMNGTGKISPKSLTTPHPESAHYVKQCHSLLDRQLQAFDAERVLWKMERQELHDRIAQMETRLSRYQSSPSSQISSPPGKHISNRTMNFRSSINASRDNSSSSAGEEVWRGSNPDMKPTRTFSESSSPPSKVNERLPSIAENSRQDPIKRFSNDAKPENILKPSISGSKIDKDLDGINFKTSGLAPEIIKSVISSVSPSPFRSPSPRLSPSRMTLSPPSLSASGDLKKDPYTMHAGHTPLASHSHKDTTFDGTASGPSSKTETPTGPEQEIPPLEPRATTIKPPSERHDSYFPNIEPAESIEDDQDPELTGPLGLTNEPDGDSRFLNALNAKLQQAAQTDANGPSTMPISNGQPSGQPDGKGEDHSDFDQPEHEPKLKIKRSMNFGSQFGARDCGKNF